MKKGATREVLPRYALIKNNKEIFVGTRKEVADFINRKEAVIYYYLNGKQKTIGSEGYLLKEIEPLEMLYHASNGEVVYEGRLYEVSKKLGYCEDYLRNCCRKNQMINDWYVKRLGYHYLKEGKWINARYKGQSNSL